MRMTAAAFAGAGDGATAEMILNGVSGVCWTGVYLLAIWIGFTYKRCAIPFFAVSLNISWEWIYSLGVYLLAPGAFSAAHMLCDGVWGLFDLLIVYSFFKYNGAHFTRRLPQALFAPGAAVVLLSSFALVYATAAPFFASGTGAQGPSSVLVSSAVSALAIGLIMSVLFVAFYLGRAAMAPAELRYTRWLTWLRFVGSLVVAITFVGGISSFAGHPSLPFLTAGGVFTAVADIACLAVLYKYPPATKE